MTFLSENRHVIYLLFICLAQLKNLKDVKSISNNKSFFKETLHNCLKYITRFEEILGAYISSSASKNWSLHFHLFFFAILLKINNIKIVSVQFKKYSIYWTEVDQDIVCV